MQYGHNGNMPFTLYSGIGIPCWSLSALLDVFPCELGDNHFLVLDKEGNEYCCCYDGCRHTFADNPVDACVAMIEKLHGHKML